MENRGCLQVRTGTKSLRGNRIYEDHKYIAKKSLNFTENVFEKPRKPWKSLNFSEKVLRKKLTLDKSPTFLNRSLNFSGNHPKPI
jgi:hypothetical protein